MSSSYPYAQSHDVIRGMPSEGRSRESIIAELTDVARRPLPEPVNELDHPKIPGVVGVWTADDLVLK